jgi:uncharacterized protein YndB with AHSA1/START domain
METTQRKSITVETIVHAPVEKVWKHWNEPESITRWCQASDDWHAPYAENDLRKDGKFKTTMAAKDGSVSFDFEGVYTKVTSNSAIEYEMADGRRVSITFTPQGNDTKVVETFDAENTHPLEMQRDGWQAILNNFKKFTENT